MCTLCDPADEAIAATVCGLDEARRLWIVIESLAQLTNSDFENGVADKSVWPHGVEEFLLGDELARTPDEIADHGEGFGPEPDYVCASPQALVGQIQAKGIEDYPFVASHVIHQTLPKLYGKFMTDNARLAHSPLLMEEWQYKAAFVIQFRPETEIGAGRFEGRVEHVASCKATRFHSLDELLSFIAKVLAEVRSTEQ